MLWLRRLRGLIALREGGVHWHWICGVLASLVLLTGCESPFTAPPAASTSPIGNGSRTIRIIAAERYLAEAARVVGGAQVSVTTVLSQPNQDPHEFEPTPSTAATVELADVVIYTGLGYDAWMTHLLQASPKPHRVAINVGEEVMGRRLGDNPHVWYDPVMMPLLVTTLTRQLASIDPSHAALFHRRAEQYVATLRPLAERVRQLRATNSVSVAVSEPVVNLLLQALHFRVTDPEFALAIEEGNEPTLASVLSLENALRRRQAHIFFFNVQTSDPTVQVMVDLARRSGVPVVPVTETMPQGMTYLTWMLQTLDNIKSASSATALSGSSRRS